jgi:DNA-binding HxlR family transcriptional regulator
MDAKPPSASSGSLAALAPERRGIPRPGEIYDPVARALDVIGDRWRLVLVRHLLLGPKGFQELRVRTGIAPRVLSSRLRELVRQGFVKSVAEGSRSVYAVTERGHSLEPIVASIARWFTRHGIDALEIDTHQFTETSPQSILESLPFLLREDRARDADVTFEIRLTGSGGGVWTVHICDGVCSVVPDFADRADVRYTADANAWCGVALGLTDARDLVKAGIMTKDGADIAMDHYFHQISQPADTQSEKEQGKEQASSQGDSSPKHENKSERRRA